MEGSCWMSRLVLLTCSFRLWLAAARCDLPGFVPPESRINVTLSGVTIPLGVIAMNWDSALIGAHVLKILLEEVLGFNTIITAAVDSTMVVYKRLAGCNASNDREDYICALLPTDHLAWEMWPSSLVIATLKTYLQERSPISLGECGFSGREGEFIFRGASDEFYASTGQSLEFYRGWNSTWTDPSPYFTPHTSIPTTRLLNCSDTYLGDKQRMKAYLTLTGDINGIENVDGGVVGKCDGGPRGHWWLSPGCRQTPSKCVPFIAAGAGWGFEQIMDRSAAYNLPIAVAAAATWDDYISLPAKYSVMFYWWKPDSTFLTYSPLRITFPVYDALAWKMGDYRTDQEVVHPLKYVHFDLVNAARAARDLLQSMSWYDADLDIVLLDAKLNNISAQQVACKWLRNNQPRWSDWIPLATVCQSSWGLTVLNGSYTHDRSNAVSCSWCKPGRYSQRIQDDLGVTFVCQTCEIGRFQDSLGSSSCVACPLGTVQSSTGASHCVECKPGTVSGHEGGSMCEACLEGFYSNKEGMTRCLHCPVGLFVDSTTSPGCGHCPVGSYSAIEGASSCISCFPGAFSMDEGMSACKVCSVGKFANATQSSECSLCSVGSYADREGMSSCTSCGIGKTAPLLWATMTKGTYFDQTGWTYSTGAESRERCGCKIEAQYQGAECVPCSTTVGMACVGMGDVLVLSGYAWDYELSVFQCFENPLRCPGGLFGHCAVGRDVRSIACSKCLPGMTSSPDGSCRRCEAVVGPVLGAIMFLLSGIVATYVVMCNWGHGNVRQSRVMMIAVLGQVATLVQHLDIMSSLAVDWHEPLRSLFMLLKLLNFGLDILQLDCISPSSEAAKFLVRASIVVIVLLFVVFIHILHMIARVTLQQEFQPTQHVSVLYNTLGSLMLLLFLPTLHTVVAPFQCDRHPNGQRTVSLYPAVWCSHGLGDEEYKYMVITSSGVLVIPAMFLSICAVAVRKYPYFVRRSDVMALGNFRFLFVRSKAESYWYTFFLVIRNALLALTPVLDNFILEVFSFELIVLLSIVLIAARMPWDTKLANVLDLILHTGVMLFVCLLSLNNKGSFNAGTDLTMGMFVLICSLAFALLIGIAITAWETLRGCFRPISFKFFLCHHKAGSGSFARVLKMQLSYVRQRAFLDCDDLKDLSSLFRYVAFQTHTFVILCSRDLFTRQWCLGEIVTAHWRALVIASVTLPGFEPYDDAWVSDFSNYVDIHCLAPHDIDVPMVQRALRWVRTRPIIQMPPRISLQVLERTTEMLLNSSFGEVTISEPDPETLDCGVIVMTCDPSNFEAVSTAIVLRALIVPHMSHEPDLAPILLLRDVGQSLSSLLHLIVICTNNVFQQGVVLDAIEVATQQMAHMLPILSDDTFRFPNSLFWEAQQTFWQAIGRDEKDLKSKVACLFDEIACVFDPSQYSSTEEVLKTKASEIARRLLSKKKARSTVRLRRTPRNSSMRLHRRESL